MKEFRPGAFFERASKMSFAGEQIGPTARALARQQKSQTLLFLKEGKGLI